MLREICNARELMPIWDEKSISWEERRTQIIQMLCNEEYGFFPKECKEVSFEVLKEEKNFCAGKVTLQTVKITAKWDDFEFSYPIYSSIPNTAGKHPFFIHINFRNCVPDRYLPIEEICDRGFAVISFCYQDVSTDNNTPLAEYKTNDMDLHDILFAGVGKEAHHCGKIGLWAWAASRAMDYAQTLDCLDMNNAAVIGHSRLGKTALLAGALDERFTFVISNNSGCSGAAISRGKKGELIKNIMERYGYWFCDNYKNYIEREKELPFDQHFLLSAIAPRRLYVSSAIEDRWADPVSEFISCYAASEVYEKLGMKGLVSKGKLPNVGEYFHDGFIGYHLRGGVHYLSREDWNLFMDYMEKHKTK